MVPVADNQKLELGLMVHLQDNMQEQFKKIEDFGIPTCQVSGTAEDMVLRGKFETLGDAMAKSKIRVSTIFAVFEGQTYNNKTGPMTDGLVPDTLREHRTELMVKLSKLVKQLGVNCITSHIGFIPDDEQDPLYEKFIGAMKIVAKELIQNGQTLCFETGQEQPSTLKRTIEDVGTGNLFINLDPANLILYGKADPLDAVAIFGKWVRGMHAKDGVWPNRDEALGHETRLGDGKVRFSLLLRRLKAYGFQGPVTIEREISGQQQIDDIRHAMKYLEPYL
jgi:L-ribulose-5-phosphate 3-epimerase